MISISRFSGFIRAVSPLSGIEVALDEVCVSVATDDIIRVPLQSGAGGLKRLKDQ